MNDEPISEQESVKLIRTMLERTQHQVKDNGVFYLLWGWLVFLAATLNYILWMALGPVQIAFLPWAVFMTLGGVATSIISSKMKRARPAVTTYTQELLNKLVIAYLASLFIILFFGIWKVGWENTYPFVMVIYGIWLFVSGSALRFRWLVAGGIFSWCMAVLSFFVPSPHQLLVLALAVLGGFIIPGHLLRNKFLNSTDEAV
ncbi:MAG: hypothetical protein MUC87_10805 [Bacteroidia bacterium]|jgi:hypothetical protein|nr:hypothetical protein [Bacteroidia bacterium]